MDDYFITKFARQIISIIKRMGGKLLLVVLWVCSCVFEKLIKIQSAMPSRSFRRPTTLLLKVIYPKYYKHAQMNLVLLLFMGRLGHQGGTDFFFEIWLSILFTFGGVFLLFPSIKLQLFGQNSLTHTKPISCTRA